MSKKAPSQDISIIALISKITTTKKLLLDLRFLSSAIQKNLNNDQNPFFKKILRGTIYLTINSFTLILIHYLKGYLSVDMEIQLKCQIF